LNQNTTIIGVFCQILWTSIIGLFYGYVVVKSKSLLPAMIMHWFGNAFIYAFSRYVQMFASSEVLWLCFIVFGLGIVPTSLMILWVRFFTTRCL
jgi:membrane protease YdiL (CAAX protease family)